MYKYDVTDPDMKKFNLRLRELEESTMRADKFGKLAAEGKVNCMAISRVKRVNNAKLRVASERLIAAYKEGFFGAFKRMCAAFEELPKNTDEFPASPSVQYLDQLKETNAGIQKMIESINELLSNDPNFSEEEVAVIEEFFDTAQKFRTFASEWLESVNRLRSK